jgi:hypothetical protein
MNLNGMVKLKVTGDVAPNFGIKPIFVTHCVISSLRIQNNAARLCHRMPFDGSIGKPSDP